MNKNFFKSIAFVCLFIQISSGYNLMYAQSETVSSEEEKPEKNWRHLVEIYMMFPSMSGEIGVGNLPAATVDADAGSILSKLKMGAMFYYEAHTNRWAITTDVLYMKLGQDVTPGTLINSGEVEMKQLGFEVAGLYRIIPFWEVGLGGRLNTLESVVNLERNSLEGPIPVYAKASKSWVDPIIITRLTTDINDKWLFMFRGDVGGFGIGSDLTWQLQAYAGYRFSKLFQTTIGYRIIAIDYDKGSGSDHFLYNVDTFGPVVRFGFNL